MKRLILYPFVLLYNILRKNILKTIWILLAISGFHFSNYYKEDLQLKEVADYVIKDTSGYHYFFKNSNTTDSFDIITTKTPLKNNTHHFTEMQGWFITFRVLGWVSLIVLIICFFSGLTDDDPSWELEECLQKSLSFLIKCELEDGKFYYIALDRLITVSDTQISDYYGNIADKLHVNGFVQILNCPKFKTKSQRRSEALDKLV